MKTFALAAAVAVALAVSFTGDANAADFATRLFEQLGRNG